jgi:hypothetical protein
MPVTDYSDDSDWLQQFMAGHMAGQAFGASQPYGPSGYPDNLPNMPYGPPGGGVMGYRGATPGAPSMGYPAMSGPQGQGQAQGAQQAPQGAQPAPGMSLTNNPIANAAQGAYGNIHDYLTMHAGLPAWLQGGQAQASPAASATAPPAGAPKRTDAAYGPYSDPNAPDPVNGYAGIVGNHPSWATTARGADANPAPANLTQRRPSYVGQPPGAGAPQGSPSQTPPAKGGSSPNLGYYGKRFGTVQYQVPGSGGGPLSRSPIYTTLNLFGGR